MNVSQRTINGTMLAIACLVVALTTSVSAVTVDVDIPGFAFDPEDITITVGDDVKWTNSHSITHTSTSDGAGWDSGDLTMGQSFTHTFNTAGVYPYHCTYHGSMTGTVTVNEPAPSVPGLNVYGAMLLVILMAASVWWVYRRRKAHVTLN